MGQTKRMAAVSNVSEVLNSGVRQSILQQLDEQEASTQELRERIDATAASIYQELGRLEQARMICETDGVWELTGRGLFAMGVLYTIDQADALIARDNKEDYWATHDPTIIPRPFQSTFNLLTDRELIRASERDTVMWRVAQEIDNAQQIDLVGVVYDLGIGRALDDAINRGADLRLLADTTLVDEVLRKRSNFSWDPADVDIRVSDADFALVVTDTVVGISLPFLDGSFDLKTMLLSDTSLARTWGTLLFTCFWEQATPIEEYLPPSEVLPVFED